MRKKTKALSGASQDAYFRRVLKEHPSLAPEQRDRLVARLREDVAQLRVRIGPRRDSESPQTAGAADTPAAVLPASIAPASFDPPATPVEPRPAASAAPPFDPYSPNVIVVVRKGGREAALAALGGIDNPDNLRLLAREQRLTVGTDLSSAAELRTAIVAAAERRIANRLAAAS